MVRTERLSRWLMYLSVFAILGALQYGITERPVSSLFALLLFLQYPAFMFWNEYRGTQPEAT